VDAKAELGYEGKQEEHQGTDERVPCLVKRQGERERPSTNHRRERVERRRRDRSPPLRMLIVVVTARRFGGGSGTNL
jgi:hypothetical protein